MENNLNYSVILESVIEDFILSSIYNISSSNLYFDPISNLSINKEPYIKSSEGS